MAERLSRKKLCDLVWSEPLRTLSSRLGISDVALNETWARAEIPTLTAAIGPKEMQERLSSRPNFLYVLPEWVIKSSSPQVNSIGTRTEKGEASWSSSSTS